MTISSPSIKAIGTSAQFHQACLDSACESWTLSGVPNQKNVTVVRWLYFINSDEDSTDEDNDGDDDTDSSHDNHDNAEAVSDDDD